MQKNFHKKYDPKKVVVIGVNTGENSNPKGNAAAFRRKHRLTYPILMDLSGSVAGSYGVEAFPTNVIIDARGVVRYSEAGFNEPAIRQMLAKLTR